MKIRTREGLHNFVRKFFFGLIVPVGILLLAINAQAFLQITNSLVVVYLGDFLIPLCVVTTLLYYQYETPYTSKKKYLRRLEPLVIMGMLLVVGASYEQVWWRATVSDFQSIWLLTVPTALIIIGGLSGIIVVDYISKLNWSNTDV